MGKTSTVINEVINMILRSEGFGISLITHIILLEYYQNENHDCLIKIPKADTLVQLGDERAKLVKFIEKNHHFTFKRQGCCS